jgi:hypothetical protein
MGKGEEGKGRGKGRERGRGKGLGTPQNLYAAYAHESVDERYAHPQAAF